MNMAYSSLFLGASGLVLLVIGHYIIKWQDRRDKDDKK